MSGIGTVARGWGRAGVPGRRVEKVAVERPGVERRTTYAVSSRRAAARRRSWGAEQSATREMGVMRTDDCGTGSWAAVAGMGAVLGLAWGPWSGEALAALAALGQAGPGTDE
jgi:hypothetical protein